MSSGYGLCAIAKDHRASSSKKSDKYENFHIDRELDKIESKLKKQKKSTEIIP